MCSSGLRSNGGRPPRPYCTGPRTVSPRHRRDFQQAFKVRRLTAFAASTRLRCGIARRWACRSSAESVRAAASCASSAPPVMPGICLLSMVTTPLRSTVSVRPTSVMSKVSHEPGAAGVATSGAFRFSRGARSPAIAASTPSPRFCAPAILLPALSVVYRIQAAHCPTHANGLHDPPQPP